MIFPLRLTANFFLILIYHNNCKVILPNIMRHLLIFSYNNKWKIPNYYGYKYGIKLNPHIP